MIFYCMYIPHFIYSCTWTFLAIVSNTAMSISVQIPVQAPAFNFFDYIPRSRIAGSDGNSV